MTTEEVAKIKQYQREFKKLFKRRLEIDWHCMNGLRRLTTFRHTRDEDYIDPSTILKECVEKYGADMEKIKSRTTRLQKSGNEKERRAVEDFSKIIIEGRFNVATAAKLINRDRTVLYHYANEE